MIRPDPSEYEKGVVRTDGKRLLRTGKKEKQMGPGSRDEMPRILGFEHMILQVADIEASRHFYLDLLGFTPRRAIPLADGRPVVPFTQGIALTAGSPGKPLQIDHMAFRVTGVRALAERLKAAKVKFFNELHDGVYGLTIYVADPDGNKVELFQEGLKLAD